MIHQIVLMEERRFMHGTFVSQYFYKKGTGNEVPAFRLSIKNISMAKVQLIVEGFEETQALTLEEIILNEVSEVTFFFFDFKGNFERKGVYRRIA